MSDRKDLVEALDSAPHPTTDRARAEALWTLLDHIDTLDDACRSDDADFRKRARRFLHRRHAILESRDGQVLTVPTTNVCEHGDHAAPGGQRFCSKACEACERAVCDHSQRACAGVCGRQQQGPS